jgi:dihydrofolate synthase/folylpolyglutamate synthase
MIKDYTSALNFLYEHIPQNMNKMFPGENGLDRVKYYMNLMGDPQDSLKVIHIAGTSGKGSTSTIISKVLTEQGFKVGLSLSPHIIDIRERFQVNDSFISEDEFYNYVKSIEPFTKKVADSGYGALTYFEIITGLAYYIFADKKVDYAVMETGMGGLLDGTNVVSSKNKVCVINQIGLDHTKILGDTIGKIAEQKAGIIQEENTVIALWQRISARVPIEKRVQEKHALLYWIKEEAIKNSKIDIDKSEFDFQFHGYKFKKLELVLHGEFQIKNCSLALAAVIIVGEKNNFHLYEDKVRSALKKVFIPGRMQVFYSQKSGKSIIADGAHNPQKMSAFIKSLKELYPNEKFTFLIAIKRDKNFSKMLKYITPVAEDIVVTSFFTKNQDLMHLSTEPEKIKKELLKLNFTNVTVAETPQEALESCLRNSKNKIVITGSFYLVAELYPYLQKAL